MLELLRAVHLRKQVIVGVVLKMAVQFSGIDAIFYYSTMMFRQANVADPQSATLMLTLVNVVMTFCAMMVMDKAGRRALIMVTWVGMCTGFLTIFAASTVVEVAGVHEALMSSVQVVAMVAIIVCFAVGIGNVEGFIISEITPVYAKDTLASIGVPINWIANMAVSSTFPMLFVSMGRYTYLLFVATTFCFGLFTWYRVPETKGKTLKEVTEEFNKY